MSQAAPCGGPAAAAAPAWRLPAAWRAVDFIADLHLAEDSPATFEALRRHLATTRADAVLLLGDVFEVWVGDDTLDDPASYESRALATLAAAAAGRSTGRLALGFMVGNRDFLFGERACAALGARPLADPTLLEAFGQRLLVAHGDAWCLDDRPYQAFRAQVRSAAWQSDFLARPLAERRAIARQLRQASIARQAGRAIETYADLDAACVDQALATNEAAALLHGHTHRPADHALSAGRTRRVLSDWHLDGPGDEPGDDPGVVTIAPRAELIRWSAAGFERLRPGSGAC